MLEVEVKARVKDMSMTERCLRDLGAIYEGCEMQQDTYYQAPHRNLDQTDEVIRIRDIDAKNGCVLTYKGPRVINSVTTREEIEVRLLKNGKALKSIFEKLGFKCILRIKKKRKMYKFKNIFIRLDRVEDLGMFVEIEAEAKDTAEKTKLSHQIYRTCEKLLIRTEDVKNKTYAELIFERG